MNVASWLPALAGVALGALLGFGGGLLKDKLQADRERARERREEERHLNRLRRERIVGLYARVLSESWSYLHKVQSGAVISADPPALVPASSELQLEQVPDEFGDAFWDLMDEILAMSLAARSEQKTDSTAPYDAAVACYYRLLAVGKRHLAELDKPVT